MLAQHHPQHMAAVLALQAEGEGGKQVARELNPCSGPQSPLAPLPQWPSTPLAPLPQWLSIPPRTPPPMALRPPTYPSPGVILRAGSRVDDREAVMVTAPKDSEEIPDLHVKPGISGSTTL